MEYRTLGRSGLKVSVLTFGTMTLGGVGVFGATGTGDVKLARRQIDMCLDHGVNLLDTANMYSYGRCEEIIGEALAGQRPADLLIATKVRMKVGPGPNDGGLSRHHIVREAEKSLKALRGEAIDIYYLHEWDGTTPLEETLSALDLLVRQGKVRYVGCSNYAGWHVMKALGIAERMGLPRFVTQQIHYTLEAREAEYELLPIGVDQGLGTLVWSPLAGGLLSGKYARGDKTLREKAGWHEPPIRDEDRLWRIVDTLSAIGREHGVSAAQVALAWLLRRPTVSSLVIGARDEAQLKDNLAALSLQLGDDELARLHAVSKPPVIYPYWHQQATARESFTGGDLVLDRS